MISRSTYRFSMQQVCVAQVRGLGKGTAHHLSPVLEVSGSIAPAAFSVSRLAPQELKEQQELQTAVRSGPYLRTAGWNQALDCPEGLLN